MSFGAYISSVYTLLGLASLAATGAFAWWKGGPPERLGTLMLAVTWIGADVARGVGGQMVPTNTLLISDLLTSAGFLYIAIRYSSLWLGAAMIFRAIGFALHAAQLSDQDAPRWHGWIIYLLVNNILSYLVLLALVGGTIATLRRRRRLEREKRESGG
jgi:MFS family permease